MLKFVSNKGGCEPVDIETTILNGYAPDEVYMFQSISVFNSSVEMILL